MAATYELIKEFTDDADPQDISVTPGWLIVVWPFKQPVTYNRQQVGSYTKDITQAYETLAPVIIRSDCDSLQIQGNKSNFMSTMNATLMLGERNYLTAFHPGDWCAAWIVQNNDQIDDIIRRLQAGEACNRWDDGFKFLGRIQSRRKRLFQNANGSRIVKYSLQALGFKEFGSKIFYDPHLAEREDTIGKTLAKMGVGINAIFREGKGIDINLAMPLWLGLLLGKGLPSRFTKPGGLTIGVGLSPDPEPDAEGSAPFAYVVPGEIGKVIGRQPTNNNGRAMSYADLLDTIYGLQRYSDAYGISALMPDGCLNKENEKHTKTPMLGFFQTLPQFKDVPVWSVLQQYLNPAINEMYTVMRADADGNVHPTLVVRQLPFSSSAVAGNNQVAVRNRDNASAEVATTSKDRPNVTPFLELPRWKLHDILIKDYDIGSSDSVRFNYVHIYGQALGAMKAASIADQIIRNPPIIDELDVARSGLQSHMQTVACSIQDAVLGEAGKWMAVTSDFLMGQHLTLNGTFNIEGISAPIAYGDNFEHDSVVYHIEAIAHIAGQDARGNRSFITSLNVSHGVRSDSDEIVKRKHGLLNADKSLYSGVWSEDLVVDNPGLTYEGQDTVDPQVNVDSGEKAGGT